MGERLNALECNERQLVAHLEANTTYSLLSQLLEKTLEAFR